MFRLPVLSLLSVTLASGLATAQPQDLLLRCEWASLCVIDGGEARCDPVDASEPPLIIESVEFFLTREFGGDLLTVITSESFQRFTKSNDLDRPHRFINNTVVEVAFLSMSETRFVLSRSGPASTYAAILTASCEPME